MIHLVVVTGDGVPVDRAGKLIMKAASAWIRLAQEENSSTWLVTSEVAPANWREHLRTNVNGLHVLVVRVRREWASFGMAKAAEWLKELDHEF